MPETYEKKGVPVTVVFIIALAVTLYIGFYPQSMDVATVDIPMGVSGGHITHTYYGFPFAYITERRYFFTEVTPDITFIVHTQYFSPLFFLVDWMIFTVLGYVLLKAGEWVEEQTNPWEKTPWQEGDPKK